MQNILVTRDLVKKSGLKDFQVWRYAKAGLLEYSKLSTGQYVWPESEVKKAKELAKKLRNKHERVKERKKMKT